MKNMMKGQSVAKNMIEKKLLYFYRYFTLFDEHGASNLMWYN